MTNTAPEAPRIVVGIDGSPASAAALDWAAHQAELTGATVEAVTTWKWPTSYGMAVPLPNDYNPADDAGKVLEGAVAAVRSAHPGLTVTTVATEGPAAPALLEAATGATLLVIGTRGHGELAGMLLGSVSEYCVAHAKCPVVVVRAP
jgi:nucleotide-binding universal stress UspA family protein